MTLKKNAQALEQRLLSSQGRFRLPTGAREVVLVRHGSTGGDTGEALQFGEITLANPPLLPAGEAQAQAVANRLQHEPIGHIFRLNADSCG